MFSNYHSKNSMFYAPTAGGGMGHSNLGTILVQKGLLKEEQYNQLKIQALNSGQPIERVIEDSKVLPLDELYKVKGEIYNIPYIKVTEERIPIEVLGRLDKDVAQKNQAIVFEEKPDSVKVAMKDPLDIQKVRFLSTIIGKRVDPYITDPQSIKTMIDTRYEAQLGSEIDEAMEDVGDIVDVSGNLSESEDLLADITSAPVARIVNMMLEYAVKNKSSDVHIEPRESKIVVRYRISGVLLERLTFPKKLGKAVVARIKILANLKIDEHRIPQDGRFQVKMDNTIIDLRVSIMPSVHGEKVVMRLLERGGGIVALDQTGMRGISFEHFKEGISRTQGIVLVTGPTGSGKTVTLASSLRSLNTPEVNILTLEDPVEIRIEGITQVQINNDVGLTFSTGLRAFLRQDPDIIMVGEIRDKETAQLAVQASLTGHLVLATLHTNSAAGAIPRLIDMGVESFLLSSTINLIGAQRLTRKICDDCKYVYEASEEQFNKVSKELKKIPHFDFEALLRKTNNKLLLYKGKGCVKCGETGYKGRMGIFEVFVMSDELKELIHSKVSAQQIEAQAIKEGMMTMIQDGFLKSLTGETTLEEVIRVVS